MRPPARPRRRRTRIGPLALLVGALALSACTGAGDDDPTARATTSEDATATATPGPTVVTTSIAPPRTLVPSEAATPAERAVVHALFTGLVAADPETGEASPAVASSIETSDRGRTWEITLEDGWTFHDGSPVTADAFVRAWNHGAYGPNRTPGRELFADIRGHGAMQCGTREATEQDVAAGTAEHVGGAIPDCVEQPPTTDELAGLEVTSPTTFTVTLERPLGSWPQKLSHAAFFPLPPAFAEDPDAFRDAPVGNGPFALEERTPDGIRTVAHDDHAGDPGPRVAGIDFRIHEDRDDALDALYDGEVDVLTDVPPERWPEARSQVANTATAPGSSLNYLGFPLDDDGYADVDLRAALSMAIDRELVTETLFDGLRGPATDLVPPVLPGHRDQVCPAWSFDPEQARQRFEEAGGIDEPLVVWLNDGRGHRPWLEAVVGQWSQHLGIDTSDVQFEERSFDAHLQRAARAGFTGPFRLGWEMTAPHPASYLQPLLDSRVQEVAGAEATGYADEDFEAALDEAGRETDPDEAVAAYQEAAEIACEDVPVVPMFFGRHAVAWTDDVEDVAVGPFGTLDYTALRAG